MLCATLQSTRSLRYRFIAYYNSSNHLFSTLSKEEREAKLASKYKPNTKRPKRIGHLANIHSDELVYNPPYAQQLNPEFYASHLLSNQKDTDQSNLNLSNVCIYEYKKKLIDKNKWEVKQSLQFALFSVVALGYPALLMLSLYRNPKRIEMTGQFTHEGIFYWTQSALMAFLVGGFLVALRFQSGSWMTMLKKKIYESTSYVSKINIIQPNTLNIEYIHNSFLNNKRLSHDIQLTDTENRCFYLQPTINPITQSPDVEVVVDLPDHKGNMKPIALPLDGSVMNWQSFITFLEDIPNAVGKFKPVKVDEDGFIPVCKYKELLEAPRTALNIYSHGIPPYKRKNTFLFVPNLNKDRLFVVYDHCKAKNESLVHKAAFYEDKGETYLHCGSCYQANARQGKVKPLRSCVEWKLDKPDNEDEATLLLKLDGSVIKNPLQFTDTLGQCALETLIGFYCTNAFRLSHPKTPEHMHDVFVCGELQQYDDWKDENSPSIASLKTSA
eukprot:129593_1